MAPPPGVQAPTKSPSPEYDLLLRISLLFSHSVMSDSLQPMTRAHQAPLFFTNSQSLLKFMSIELVMLSNHLIQQKGWAVTLEVRL